MTTRTALDSPTIALDGAPEPTQKSAKIWAGYTDKYEYTMYDSVVESGLVDRRCVFEVFSRQLPAGRAYGVVAGVGRLLRAIEEFRIDEELIVSLLEDGSISEVGAERLRAWEFRGEIWGYQEGELWFPYSPILTIEATFGEAVLLETLILSILNGDSAVAAAASRITDASGGAVIDMGSRRANEEAAVAAARAAYIGGVDATSNLEAGRRYAVPTAGTAAHAYTLLHDNEYDAFVGQLRTQGLGTTLLVDTYDIEDGIRNAVRAAGELGAAGPGAIRIDSGDLAANTRRARQLLDELGASQTRIVVSGDLDEWAISRLEGAGPEGNGERAPIDAYGVGTRLVTGSGHPTCGFVYKLVARENSRGELESVAKKSANKVSVGGRKAAWRLLDGEGYAHTEEITLRRSPFAPMADGPRSRALVVAHMLDGRRVDQAGPGEEVRHARSHHLAARAELRQIWRQPREGGKPAIGTSMPN